MIDNLIYSMSHHMVHHMMLIDDNYKFNEMGNKAQAIEYRIWTYCALKSTNINWIKIKRSMIKSMVFPHCDKFEIEHSIW